MKTKKYSGKAQNQQLRKWKGELKKINKQYDHLIKSKAIKYGKEINSKTNIPFIEIYDDGAIKKSM